MYVHPPSKYYKGEGFIPQRIPQQKYTEPQIRKKKEFILDGTNKNYKRPEYDSLRDKHLKYYFKNKNIIAILYQTGVVDQYGHIIKKSSAHHRTPSVPGRSMDSDRSGKFTLRTIRNSSVPTLYRDPYTSYTRESLPTINTRGTSSEDALRYARESAKKIFRVRATANSNPQFKPVTNEELHMFIERLKQKVTEENLRLSTNENLTSNFSTQRNENETELEF